MSETPNLEFKEAKNQYDNEKLYEYCVAIANEGGGFLLIGINNISPSTTVVDRRPVEAIRAFGSDSVAHGMDVFFAIGTSAADVQHRAIRARADV